MSETIPSLLRAAAARYGDQPFLVSAVDGATGFATVDAEADRVARALIADGMAHGERIAIWAPNMWEWVAAAVGVQRVGGAIVPLNTRLRGGEVADIVRRGGVTRLFSVGDFLGRHYPDMLRPEAMPGLQKVVVLRADPAKLAAGEQDMASFLAAGEGVDDAALRAREAMVTPDTHSDIMFTSGTTGQPKGALFDHKRSILGARVWIRAARFTDADCASAFGPFSHNASYKAGWLVAIVAGSTLCWPESYDSEALLNLIADNKVTILAAPPTVLQEMMDRPNRLDWDISSVRFLSTGSTVIPIELMRRLRDETDIAVLSTGYGMTECCGTATQTRPGDDISLVVNTVGQAVPGTEIRIAGPDGRSLPPGEAGEILIRDDKLLIEYLDNPEATRATLDAEGWLHSGDVGTLDDKGYLKITDRLKDMYIVGGFNVYPAEIERQIGALPGLQQCAIVGIPDPRLGEVGHAFIVRSPGSTLSEADVLAWSKANLANYKIPRAITFVDALPMNSTGKVIKFALKEMIQ